MGDGNVVPDDGGVVGQLDGHIVFTALTGLEVGQVAQLAGLGTVHDAAGGGLETQCIFESPQALFASVSLSNMFSISMLFWRKEEHLSTITNKAIYNAYVRHI